ncbi:MAG: hypothetical protein R3Y43_06200 [Alphaproteobacteria bacterium]
MMKKSTLTKRLLTLGLLFIPLSSYAQDLSSYTPARIRAIYKQAVADEKSILSMQKALDKRHEDALIIEQSASAQLQDLEDMGLDKSQQEADETQRSTQAAKDVINNVENKVKATTNARQGFGTVE